MITKFNPKNIAMSNNFTPSISHPIISMLKYRRVIIKLNYMKNSKIIIASGPVIVEDNKVLLNISSGDNFWKFCGGRVENFDDNLMEAAKREAREEMGIGIKILDENPFLLHTTKDAEDGKKVDIILVHYLAKRIGEMTPGDDTQEWKWIPLSGLEAEDLAPNIMPVLDYFGFIE